jgi:hypothetical protein
MSTTVSTPHKLINVRLLNQKQVSVPGNQKFIELWFASLFDANRFIEFVKEYELALADAQQRAGSSSIHETTPDISVLTSTLRRLSDDEQALERLELSTRNDCVHLLYSLIHSIAMKMHIWDGYDPMLNFCQPQLNITQGLLTFSWRYPEHR